MNGEKASIYDFEDMPSLVLWLLGGSGEKAKAKDRSELQNKLGLSTSSQMSKLLTGNARFSSLQVFKVCEFFRIDDTHDQEYLLILSQMFKLFPKEEKMFKKIISKRRLSYRKSIWDSRSTKEQKFAEFHNRYSANTFVMTVYHVAGTMIGVRLDPESIGEKLQVSAGRVSEALKILQNYGMISEDLILHEESSYDFEHSSESLGRMHIAWREETIRFIRESPHYKGEDTFTFVMNLDDPAVEKCRDQMTQSIDDICDQVDDSRESTRPYVVCMDIRPLTFTNIKDE